MLLADKFLKSRHHFYQYLAQVADRRFGFSLPLIKARFRLNQEQGYKLGKRLADRRLRRGSQVLIEFTPNKVTAILGYCWSEFFDQRRLTDARVTSDKDHCRSLPTGAFEGGIDVGGIDAGGIAGVGTCAEVIGAGDNDIEESAAIEPSESPNSCAT